VTHDESVPFVVHAFAKRSTGDVLPHVPGSIAERVRQHGEHKNGQTSWCQRGCGNCDGVPVVLGLRVRRRATLYASY